MRFFGKEKAFSDGVGKATKSWFEIIQDHVMDNIYGEDLVNKPTPFEKKVEQNILLSKKRLILKKIYQ